MAKELPITEFDLATLSESTQMLKAMIPFLDFELQKSFSMIIRITELQQTMEFYNNPYNYNAFSACNAGPAQKPVRSLQDIMNNEKLINTVLVYCPQNIAPMIKNAIQFSKISELMNLLNPDESSPLNMGDMLSKMNPDILASMGNMFGFNDFKQDSHTESSSNSGNKSNSNGNSNANSNTNNYSNNNSNNHSNNNSSESSKGSSMSNNMFSSFLNPEQQKLYDSYINQLDHLDFDKMT
jgi:hypothetical protein